MRPEEIDGPLLSVELVPSTAWWANVRSNVSRADWEKCKDYSKSKTNGVCIICGGVGERWATEAHEIWRYDVRQGEHRDPTAPEEEIIREAGIQTLVDIWPLCTMCHRVKHLGHTRQNADLALWTRVIEHLQGVNQWPGHVVEAYVVEAFRIWEIRSTMRWELDISFLNTIGIEPRHPGGTGRP